jgi:hypothetical protein
MDVPRKCARLDRARESVEKAEFTMSNISEYVPLVDKITFRLPLRQYNFYIFLMIQFSVVAHLRHAQSLDPQGFSAHSVATGRKACQ